MKDGDIFNHNGEMRVWKTSTVQEAFKPFTDRNYGDITDRDDRNESDRNLVERSMYNDQKDQQFIKEIEAKINGK